ncbi:Alpha/Beta hydrolase protein [Bombardia bombarda]|uniref:Alpha/Beta hydrolase protein n=1 Tax=Bombardia bombarda TaxID=252184 RepID=A0AA39XN08_9PEZI|nr:Alpha/Beta hydrolase protein [Bombardia bombarda]
MSSSTEREFSFCKKGRGVKAYSGFVNLPPAPGLTYNQSIFFWYFKSEKDTANIPTTIYLPGGPGTSFLDSFSGFPCIVNADSNSTTPNPWSWNNEVNMLYIDQPVQTGYSNTDAQDGLMNLITQEFTPGASLDGIEGNATALPGRLSSQNPADTANKTAQAVQSLWRFAQAWLQE